MVSIPRTLPPFSTLHVRNDEEARICYKIAKSGTNY
jgi:hypothetical protein